MSLVGEQLPVWGLLEARYCARESATVWVHQFEELTRDETQALQEHRLPKTAGPGPCPAPANAPAYWRPLRKSSMTTSRRLRRRNGVKRLRI